MVRETDSQKRYVRPKVMTLKEHETYVHLCGDINENTRCGECPFMLQVACLREHVVEESLADFPSEVSLEQRLEYYFWSVPIILGMWSEDKGSRNPFVI